MKSRILCSVLIGSCLGHTPIVLADDDGSSLGWPWNHPDDGYYYTDDYGDDTGLTIGDEESESPDRLPPMCPWLAADIVIPVGAALACYATLAACLYGRAQVEAQQTAEELARERELRRQLIYQGCYGSIFDYIVEFGYPPTQAEMDAVMDRFAACGAIAPTPVEPAVCEMPDFRLDADNLPPDIIPIPGF